jgi:hypothetical protein
MPAAHTWPKIQQKRCFLCGPRVVARLYNNTLGRRLTTYATYDHAPETITQKIFRLLLGRVNVLKTLLYLK